MSAALHSVFFSFHSSQIFRLLMRSCRLTSGPGTFWNLAAKSNADSNRAPRRRFAHCQPIGSSERGVGSPTLAGRPLVRYASPDVVLALFGLFALILSRTIFYLSIRLLFWLEVPKETPTHLPPKTVKFSWFHHINLQLSTNTLTSVHRLGDRL